MSLTAVGGDTAALRCEGQAQIGFANGPLTVVQVDQLLIAELAIDLAIRIGVNEARLLGRFVQCCLAGRRWGERGGFGLGDLAVLWNQRGRHEDVELLF